MTIAAGFLCEDGIVICADREVTTDFEKYEESKIFTVNSDSSPATPTAIIAGSGWLDFVKMAVRQDQNEVGICNLSTSKLRRLLKRR